MERYTSARLRRAQFRKFALSISSIAAICLSVWQGPFLVTTLVEKGKQGQANLSSRISTLMKVEQVIWEEKGSTNLSRLVTKDLLWKKSGLKKGQEMLSIDLSELEKNILSIPWIESAQIQKKLPSTISVLYTTHEAKALALRKNKPWVLSVSGEWIAPLEIGAVDDVFDFALLTDEKNLEEQIAWLDALESTLKPYLLMVHEVSWHAGKSNKVSALVELRFNSKNFKTTVVGLARPEPESLARLKKVVQYLIKNNLLVSRIDLRSSKKVVVNVGNRP